MYICKDCFLDEELRSEINANAVINGVCDVCGKEVFCKQQSGLAQMRFNREGIPSGLYFIEVVCDKTQIQTIKLLIGN